jgi:hypothetical protein
VELHADVVEGNLVEGAGGDEGRLGADGRSALFFDEQAGDDINTNAQVIRSDDSKYDRVSSLLLCLIVKKHSML